MKFAICPARIGVPFSLLLCAGLATPLAGCNLFRKKSSSSAKSTAPGPKILEAEIHDPDGAALNDSIQAKDYRFSFSLKDPTLVSGLATVEVAISPSDSSIFENMQVAIPMGVTIRHADGTVDTRTSTQPYLSDKQGLIVRGLFKVRAGDVMEITVSDIPDVLSGADLYVYASSNTTKEETDGDVLDPNSGGGYWSARKMAPAASGEEISQRILKVGVKGLYSFNTYVGTLKPTPVLMPRVDFVGACFEEPGAVGSGSVSSTLGGTPWSVLLVKSETDEESEGAGDVCQGYNGSVTVDTDAAPATFESKATGVTPNETYVEFRQNAMSESDFVASKLGTVEAAVGSANGRESTSNVGRFEKQKVSFLIKGVSKETGLKLQLSSNFLYPMNIPEVAASNFNGAGLAATLRYASGPKTGQPITDSKGTVLEVFKLEELGIAKVRYLSFEEARLPDLEDGDYEVTLDFPPHFPAGVYLNATLYASRMSEVVEGLDPAIITEFKARDAASGAVVHDWPQADYSTAFNPPKRERIAMVAVAKAMEEIRDAMHLAVNRTNPWTGAKPTLTALNVIDRDTADSCLNSNEAPHWSDITLHYYCQINEARACYTDGIRAIAGYMQMVQAEETAKGGGEAAIKGAIACRLPSMKMGPVTLPVLTFDPNYKYPTLRQYIFNQCATAPSTALDSVAVPASAIPGCLARSDIQAYAADAGAREYFSWLTKDPERAKVFRYIMEAPTFAFDEKDQQDLINAFYRVKKPSDPSDCAKRTRRAIDKEPDPGKPSVCEVGHDQDPPRAAAGR